MASAGYRGTLENHHNEPCRTGHHAGGIGDNA